MNERIKQLRSLLKKTSHHQFRKEELDISILDQETSSKAFVVRKALSLKKAFEQMPVFIQEGELIVGGRTIYKLPEYVLPREIEDGNPNFEDEGYDNVFNIHYNLGQDERGYGRPDGDPPHYFRIVRDGFPAYKQRVRQKLIDSTIAAEREYYEAVLIGYEGFETLIERYARLAEEQAKEQEGSRSAELMRIAVVCRNSISRRPQGMWEALQLIYFIHFSCWTEDAYLIPIGRLDQILFDVYTKDVQEAGRLCDEDIKELIECFYIKLNYEIDKTHGKSGKFESDTGQTVVLGGLDPITGEDASNELTLMCLDICEELRLTDPKIHIRLHPKTKESVWDKAVHLASLGMGFPTFDNDEAIFKALRNVGPGYYSERDILDYGISGCWEVIIPGRTSFRQCCNFDMLQVLEWTLNRGRFFRNIRRTSSGPFADPAQWGIDLGDPKGFMNFSDLLIAYKKQLRFGVMMNAYHIISSRVTHQPFLSSFIEDCIERGKDINEGGVRYNETDMQACSMANAADSLYIIKKLVYDEKRFSLQEFLHIIQKDYQGHEELRQEILNKYVHFGNDNDEVDSIAKEIVECFADEYNRYTNSLNGPFRARISGATSTVYFSTVLGPSADGRRQGDLLAHNASPQAGLAKNGPTAIINSLTTVDTTKFAGGEILTLKFTPKVVQGTIGEAGLKHLIKTYFKLGGLQLQTNVVDSAVLLDAQIHPEAHKDLIVRVWGFSTYFISLPKSYQDQIIHEVAHGVE